MAAPNLPNGETAPTPPLKNLRIVDFGWAMAGPQATRILADFGAEVIRVESMARPDAARVSFGPFSENQRGVNRSFYFYDFNRNKRSVRLNMAKPEARQVFAKLVRISNVVADNFSPGVLSRWGFPYEELCRLRPGIIYIGMSGFGGTGPYRNYRTFGPTVQAVSGLTYLGGLPDPSWPPSGWGYSYMDHTGGFMGTIAILSAYYHQVETGEGQSIDLSQVEGGISLTGTAILDYQANGRMSAPPGNDPPYPVAAPQDAYRCRGEDRWIALSIRTDEEWKALCQVIQRPEWATDARFSSLEGRREHREELARGIEEWASQQDLHEAAAKLQSVGVIAGAVQNGADIWDLDPQIQHLGLLVSMEHPEIGQAPVEGMPIKLSEAEPNWWRSAPLLGQDNDYVYGELLGMDAKEIAQLIEAEVIY